MDDSVGNIGQGITLEDGSSTFDFTKQTWRDDVTFLVGGKRLFASKCVVAIVSPVFESMFGTDFREKTENEVALPGKKVEDFLEFLHCLYPNSERTITRENVFQVLPLADEYQVRPLLEKCKEALQRYIADGKHRFSISDLLKCFTLATRHNISGVDFLCVEKILNEENAASTDSEAEKTMDKESLLKFRTAIIAEQSKRLSEVTTKFVQLSLKTSDVNTSGFESALGDVIEHKIENVFDPKLKYDTHSKSAKLWNASFRLKISVANKEINGQNEKYLSVYLNCSLPMDKWLCEVRAVIVLENLYATTNKIITTRTISKEFKSPGTLTWGYEHFDRLSKFLTGIPETIENYTGKLVVYILAKQPVKELIVPE